MTGVPPGRLETVELTEGEHIVARGSARSLWYVRVNDGWVRARELPGAQVESLNSGPGSVWQRRIIVQLARGTELLLERSAPDPALKTPLAHLEHGRSAARRVTRTPHRVSRGGALERS